MLGHCYEVWLSLVERFVRDEEAAGSNPVTSTFLFLGTWRLYGKNVQPFFAFSPKNEPAYAAY